MLIKKGSTSKSVYLRLLDATTGAPYTSAVYNSSGIDLWYRREGGSKTAITEATLASLTTAWASGGFLHVGDGDYRLDVPDAAFATGANDVRIGGALTGAIVVGTTVQLIDIDLLDTVRAGLTALPNAVAGATGGLPTVDSTNSVGVKSNFKKNTARSEIPFVLTDSTSHQPKAGVDTSTITIVRSIDSGTDSAGTISGILEIANGRYTFDAAAGDMNGNFISVLITAPGCDPYPFNITTTP